MFVYSSFCVHFICSGFTFHPPFSVFLPVLFLAAQTALVNLGAVVANVGLMPLADDEPPFVPRLGSFEVTVVLPDGRCCTLFSKIACGKWPDLDDLAARAAEVRLSTRSPPSRPPDRATTL